MLALAKCLGKTKRQSPGLPGRPGRPGEFRGRPESSVAGRTRPQGTIMGLPIGPQARGAPARQPYTSVVAVLRQP